MRYALDTRKGNFVVRTSVPNGSKVSGNMTTLEKIAWMKEHNPRARLIPFSVTYFKAVAELNMLSRGNMVRPEVPEWFCGHINPVWPYFEDDARQQEGGNPLLDDTSGKGKDGDNDEYPWDKCCEIGLEPNTPGYMWCDEDTKLVAINGDTSFLADFTIDDVYANAEWPEGILGGDQGDCTPAEGMPARSGEWSCGGWGGGTIGAVNATITGASISGRSTMSWRYSSGQSTINSWGGAKFTLVCLGLKANGVWYSGKIDHLKVGQTNKSLKNVKCGYKGWTQGVLDAATEAKMCVCNEPRGICTNWATVSISGPAKTSSSSSSSGSSSSSKSNGIKNSQSSKSSGSGSNSSSNRNKNR